MGDETVESPVKPIRPHVVGHRGDELAKALGGITISDMKHKDLSADDMEKLVMVLDPLLGELKSKLRQKEVANENVSGESRGDLDAEKSGGLRPGDLDELELREEEREKKKKEERRRQNQKEKEKQVDKAKENSRCFMSQDIREKYKDENKKDLLGELKLKLMQKEVANENISGESRGDPDAEKSGGLRPGDLDELELREEEREKKKK